VGEIDVLQWGMGGGYNGRSGGELDQGTGIRNLELRRKRRKMVRENILHL